MDNAVFLTSDLPIKLLFMYLSWINENRWLQQKHIPLINNLEVVVTGQLLLKWILLWRKWIKYFTYGTQLLHSKYINGGQKRFKPSWHSLKAVFCPVPM